MPLFNAMNTVIFYSFILSSLVAISACSTPAAIPTDLPANAGRDPDRLLVVDCLLPGQLRRLGGNITFMTPRRPTKATVSECEIRGGEYVAYDRANFATSLKIWLPKAETGDPEAQTFVGEIFEKGLGQVADPLVAAQWYEKAADQGYSRALINLGYLYESGLGVEQDMVIAMNYYRQAVGFTDGKLEYVTSVQIANRKQQDAELPVLRAQIEQSNAQLQSEQQAFAQLQTEFNALEEEAESIRSEISLQNNESRSQPTENSESSVQVGALLNEIQSLKTQLAESESDTNSILDQLEQQQQQTSELRKQLAGVTKKLHGAQDELSEQTNQIGSLESQIAAAQSSDAADKDARVRELQVQLSSTKNSQKALQEQVEQLKTQQSEEASRLETQLTVAEAREDSLVIDLEASRTALLQLQGTLKTKDDDYLKRISALGRTNTGLESRLALQQSKITELEDEISTIEETRNSESTEIANRAASEILRLQAELELAQAELEQSERERESASQNSIEKLSRLEKELGERRSVIEAQQNKVDVLQRKVSQDQATKAGPAIEEIPTVVSDGPIIEIIDPPVRVRNGVMAIPVFPTRDSIDVIGRVSHDNDLLSFRINGGQQTFNEQGIFQHSASTVEAQRLELAAVDVAGLRTAVDVELYQESTAPAATRSHRVDVSQLNFGEYHALVIGNTNYQQMPPIGTAITDATAIAKVLENQFGFNAELLLDADRYDILAALNRKRDELTRDDNLLIYYAGHGEIGRGKGYWLPTDAEPDDKDTWVSNASVTSIIDSMTAKHVIVVADSIFSGTLSRSSLVRRNNEMDADEQLRFFDLVTQSRVRTVLTSGATRPFTENVREDDHSVFSASFLKALSDTDEQVLMAQELFMKIRDSVSSVSPSTNSVTLPQYAPLQYAGHENGEFLFIPMDRTIGRNSPDLESTLVDPENES